jgi:hypothetical protein
MRIVTLAYRTINRALEQVGLEIRPIQWDFDARLDSPRLLARMHKALAESVSTYLAHQAVFQSVIEFDVEGTISDLYSAYLESPFRHAGGGSRFNNLVWLHVLAKAYAPTVVIDSGTYHGASAWALAQAVPGISVHSFDIDQSRLKLHAKHVRYHEFDWTEFDQSQLDMGKGFCYFDDHVDQARRLLEAAERGYQFVVFDDDFPVSSFAPMAHGGIALPKIEFVLDNMLASEREVSWTVGRRRYVWPIDHSKLERARTLIWKTDRLPDTSSITGIQQTPYRIVALKKPQRRIAEMSSTLIPLKVAD